MSLSSVTSARRRPRRDLRQAGIGRAALARRRRPPVRLAGSAGRRLAGQPRAREAARRARPTTTTTSGSKRRTSASPRASSARSRGCGPGDPGSYTLSLEEAWDKLRRRAHQPLTEVHVVNGLHPDLPFDYYKDLLRGFKRIRPEIHLKCFTAVEIAFFADLYGMTDEQVLRELMDAGLDSLPGGGAEVFAERVRRKICHDKADADRYLSIHRTAHRLGHALERDDALRAHRDVRRARRPHAADACAAGRDRRRAGVHPAGVSSRQQPDAEAAGALGGRHAARARRRRG